MNKVDVANLMIQMCSEESETREAGQLEYAHENNNAFRNFENLARELGLDRKTVLWIYLRKHLDGILAHINGHVSQREPVQGRIKDARVYLCLLRGMIDEDQLAAKDKVVLKKSKVTVEEP